MVTEEDFDRQEREIVKQALRSRNIGFKRPIDDPDCSYKLDNFCVVFFYKKNGEKLYNCGITPNECNVIYLTEYTPDLNAVLDIIQPHLSKRYFACENRKCEKRSQDTLLREIEELLNERGIEAFRGRHRILELPHDVELKVDEKQGMAEFQLYDKAKPGYAPLSGTDFRDKDRNICPPRRTLDLLEIVKAYHKIVASRQNGNI